MLCQGCAEERDCGDHLGMRHETVPGYRYGLNRFVPAAFTGDVLLIPSREREGKFEIVEDGKRFVSPAILDTPPMAKLVEAPRGLPWHAPTVVFEPEYPDSESRRESKPFAASDYRYIQQAARRRTVLPVLDYESGWIYNLANILRAIDLLDYSRILAVAAQRSVLKRREEPRESLRA